METVCSRVCVPPQGLSGSEDGRAEAVLGSSVDAGEDAKSHGGSERGRPLTPPFSLALLGSFTTAQENTVPESTTSNSCDITPFYLFTKLKQSAAAWLAASLDALLLILDGHSEAFLQQGELADQVSDGICKRFLSKHMSSVTSPDGTISSTVHPPPGPLTCGL